MKISMVTICFNAENVIEKTIKSVLNQSEPVYEYILVDGASKDRSYEIIKSYEKQFADKGIRYLHLSEKDKGISDAFNKGIARATGDLVGIINADDELLPDTCKILKKYASENPADVYYGDCIWVDEKNKLEYISKPKHDLEKLLYHMVLIHPSTFVMRTAYEECGGFDISYRYCMDKELLYRFLRRGKTFYYIEECFTKFKAGGVSDSHAKAVFKEDSRMAMKYGEPFLKVKLIEKKKLLKDSMSRILKKTPLYLMIKNKKNLYEER